MIRRNALITSEDVSCEKKNIIITYHHHHQLSLQSSSFVSSSSYLLTSIIIIIISINIMVITTYLFYYLYSINSSVWLPQQIQCLCILQFLSLGTDLYHFHECFHAYTHCGMCLHCLLQHERWYVYMLYY